MKPGNHGVFVIRPCVANDDDYCLSTSCAAAGSTETFTKEYAPEYPRLRLSTTSTTNITVTLTYVTIDGDETTEQHEINSTTSAYTNECVVELEEVSWTAGSAGSVLKIGVGPVVSRYAPELGGRNWEAVVLRTLDVDFSGSSYGIEMDDSSVSTDDVSYDFNSKTINIDFTGVDTYNVLEVLLHYSF